MNRLVFILATCSVLFLSFGGCEDRQINPYNEETGLYSVYGAIDLHETKNSIRVKNLKIPFDSEDSKLFDASVTFFDLRLGTSELLRDSIVAFPANYTHNFVLDKNLDPSSPYQIIVERPDGEFVSSMFSTPAVTETEVSFTGEKIGCYTPLKLVFKNVLPNENIRVHFGVRYQKQMYWYEFSRICPEGHVEGEDEFIIETKPYLLLDLIWPEPGMDPPPNCRDPRRPTVLCSDLDSPTFTIRYWHLGPEWQKVYPAWPVNPDNVGDVENGLGFLGAFREDTLIFTVTD